MKKIKKKYANQSDDERRMRMAALAIQCQRYLLKASRCTQMMMIALASMAKRRLDPPKRLSFAIKSERQRQAKLAADQRLRNIEAEEPGGSDFLDTLTGKPCADDVFRYALPVCACTHPCKVQVQSETHPRQLKARQGESGGHQHVPANARAGQGQRGSNREGEGVHPLDIRQRPGPGDGGEGEGEPPAGAGGGGKRKKKGGKGGKRAAAGKKKK